MPDNDHVKDSRVSDDIDEWLSALSNIIRTSNPNSERDAAALPLLFQGEIPDHINKIEEVFGLIFNRMIVNNIRELNDYISDRPREEMVEIRSRISYLLHMRSIILRIDDASDEVGAKFIEAITSITRGRTKEEVDYQLASITHMIETNLHTQPQVLSDKTRPLYKDRPNKSQKASEFFMEHWGGVEIYQPQLRKADPHLMQGLSNEFKGRRDELRKLIPTKQDEVDKRISALAGGPVRPDRRRMAVIASNSLRYARAETAK